MNNYNENMWLIIFCSWTGVLQYPCYHRSWDHVLSCASWWGSSSGTAPSWPGRWRTAGRRWVSPAAPRPSGTQSPAHRCSAPRSATNRCGPRSTNSSPGPRHVSDVFNQDAQHSVFAWCTDCLSNLTCDWLNLLSWDSIDQLQAANNLIHWALNIVDNVASS